ncbi:hypothetical protein ACVV4J_02535 [Escherichia coli]
MKYIATSVVAMLLLSGCDNTQSNNSSPSETEVGVVTLKSQPVSVVSELTGRTSAALSAEVRPQVGELSRNAYLRKVIWSRLDSLSTRLMRPVIRLHGMKPGSITTSTGTGKSRLPESAALCPTGEREWCFTTGC